VRNHLGFQALAEPVAHTKTGPNGVKCADVAKKTGIAPATLCSVLACRRGISKASARKLASYFDISRLAFLMEPEAG
jgi:plasmid maintenance system antidote protein VapI